MTAERRKIVVTGASGNVGTGVLRALAAALPLDEVVGICRRPPVHGPGNESVTWHRLDLSETDAVNPPLFRFIVTALHAEYVLPVTPGWYDVAMNSPLMDTSRARDMLDWSPTRSSADSARELLDGLARGCVGLSAAMGATKDERSGLRRAADRAQDASLLLWTAATLLRAVGVRRGGVPTRCALPPTWSPAHQQR